MKIFYRIFILLITFLLLTTFNPGEINFFPNKSKNYFSINKIEITNNQLISKNDINEKLKHVYKKNILFIDKKQIVEPLITIDFLGKIKVKKKYPNTILITVYETIPIGLLYKINNKYFLDSLSHLYNYEEGKFSNFLPHIIGENSEKEFMNLYSKLKKLNFPIEKIKNYYYFQIDRWDLEFLKGQLIKLPAEKVNKAIEKSIEIINQKEFENYKVIDLRIDGKIITE